MERHPETRRFLLPLVKYLVMTLVMAASITTAVDAQKSILVVTVTKGFRHPSIETAEGVLEQIADRNGFRVSFARTDGDLQSMMSEAALYRLDAVIFANTTGDLPLPDSAAFLAWIAAGHGFIGVHSAADTFHGFPAYLDMLGGEFDSHGDQATVIARVHDSEHPATRDFDASMPIFDEIYLFKRFDPQRVQLLLSLDQHPNSGEAGSFPVAWWRRHGSGRVFYTSLGHREDIWEAPWFQQHLTGAILWATTPSRRRPVRIGGQP